MRKSLLHIISYNSGTPSRMSRSLYANVRVKGPRCISRRLMSTLDSIAYRVANSCTVRQSMSLLTVSRPYLRPSWMKTCGPNLLNIALRPPLELIRRSSVPMSLDLTVLPPPIFIQSRSLDRMNALSDGSEAKMSLRIFTGSLTVIRIPFGSAPACVRGSTSSSITEFLQWQWQTYCQLVGGLSIQVWD